MIIKFLSAAQKMMPQYKMLWLLNLDYYWPSWMLRINYTIIRIKLIPNNLQGVIVRAGNALNEKFVKTFKTEVLMVFSWTVNEVLITKKLFTYGVDAIITDRTSWLFQQLSLKVK